MGFLGVENGASLPEVYPSSLGPARVPRGETAAATPGPGRAHC